MPAAAPNVKSVELQARIGNSIAFAMPGVRNTAATFINYAARRGLTQELESVPGILLGVTGGC
jgi:hypothetical protein